MTFRYTQDRGGKSVLSAASGGRHAKHTEQYGEASAESTTRQRLMDCILSIYDCMLLFAPGIYERGIEVLSFPRVFVLRPAQLSATATGTAENAYQTAAEDTL